MTSYRILGLIEVWKDGARLPLGGPRQLKLLAFLLLRANQAISTDMLGDAIWGSSAPTGLSRLHMAIARLRKTLKPLEQDEGSSLQTVSGGYLLVVAPGALDSDLFVSRIEEGRRLLDRGDPARATQVLTSALKLWRGGPLAEVAFEDFAQGEIRRLEELRLVAVETRADAELELGRHSDLIGELQRAHAEQPTRERLTGQLMLALYRAGRQVEALDAYQRTRTGLLEDLGLEPGPALKAFQAQILEHAPGLQPADWPPDVAPPSPPELAVDRAESEPPRVASLPLLPNETLGRAREVEAVSALLASSKSRLITLTGPGGVGKTRLALATAHAVSSSYQDGACWVELAAVADPEDVAPTVVRSLALTPPHGESATEALHRHLADKRLLLVLDNFEHLLGAAKLVADLLAATPGLRVLSTSREPLRLAWEQQYEVPVLEPKDAVELFITRARAGAIQVELDATVTAEICERLDRLPLAIELAAVRTKMLSAGEILTRLERRLPVTAAGPRNAPQRQRTLRATIDWSYDLLGGEEQRLFRRIAVFANGWTLAAAEAVCDAGLDTLESLIDRSLIKTNGERYWMLETLRQYAADKLAGASEEECLRRRHARWFLELVQAHTDGEHTLEVGLETIQMLLGVERENLTAALAWALQAGDFEIAIRLAVPLSPTWIHEGRLSDVDRWLTIAAPRANDFGLPVRAGILWAARQLAQARGDHAEAVALSERSLPLYRELRDVVGSFRETLNQAGVRGFLGDMDGARAGIEKALEFAREHLAEHVPSALIYLADLEIAAGRLDQARICCEEALRLSGTDSYTVRYALINLAHIANLQHRIQEAANLARNALDKSIAAGDQDSALAATLECGWSIAEQIPPESTARLLGAALEGYQRTGIALQLTDTVARQAILDALRKQQIVGPTLTTLTSEGSRMSIEQAVREAVQHLDEPASIGG